MAGFQIRKGPPTEYLGPEIVKIKIGANLRDVFGFLSAKRQAEKNNLQI